MKKTVYLIILVVITCVCVAIGICSHLFKLFSFDIGFGSKMVSVSEELEDFKGIDLDLNLADLTIVEGKDFGISYDGEEKLQPTYRVENDVLILKQNVKHISHMNNECNVTITVPDGTSLDDVSLYMDAGEIALSDLEMNNLTIDADAGDLDMARCTIENVNIDADAGDLDMARCTIENVNIDADAGDLDMEYCTIETGKIDADAGDIDLEDVILSKGEISANAGDIGIQVSDFEELNISADMGAVDVDFPFEIEECSFDLKVDVGDISIGEDSHGTTYNREATKGNRSLKVRCSFGDIDINDK